MKRSPSTRRAWIEMLEIQLDAVVVRVSPSTRRAWIEMPARAGWVVAPSPVALHPEGVDRNN